MQTFFSFELRILNYEKKLFAYVKILLYLGRRLPTSARLGRLALPERLLFSKPKVNWLLHPQCTFASCWI